MKPPTTPTMPTPFSEDSDSDQDEQKSDVDIVQVNDLWMNSWVVLLDHIFGRTDKGIEIGNTKYDALFALFQVYLNMKDYEKAKIILGVIQNSKEHSEMDWRPHLLEAILNLTMAVEKLRQGKITENGARELIENAKESWGRYKKLEEGFGLPAPPVED
ncbi:uncharacterized protein LOC122021139 [Zingiber officinale]|uniref:Uncharacterized protein n=1 Tax=Zingiber officinale TaxID=94328 RepID=A0A8J5EZY9_ZINOF|nr:uncharacterized protein LOC122021139 [Zingiber officinale]KAG6478670.1 hypothetical protein ZIOFF_062114 [Zingiber officinale]